MRKSTTLLLLAAVALAGVACFVALGAGRAAAETLGPTDSGAPSAIVIFPVGENPNPGAVGMPPVAFNHVIHEKWMAKAGKDCVVCHHTGDPIACTTCHTVQGRKEGNFITLYQAMHKVEIAKRAEDTPSSCVSCHNKQLQRRKCAGCHTNLVHNQRTRETSAWCNVCHMITPSMTTAQMKEGIENKLPEPQNEQLAEETALQRKQTRYWSPRMAPYKVKIDTLAGKYEPVIFNHRQHVKTLLDRIEHNQLAGAFHTQAATICVTCHHNSPPSATPPKCVSCHKVEINVANPTRPRLQSAFHLQCMKCHSDMKVARPRNTDCTTCHKLRPTKSVANQGEKQ